MPHMTDEDREALAKEALISLGRQLGQLRREAGYNQWNFAPLTGYSRGSLSDAELGRNWLHRQFWETADAALKMDGNLVASFDRIAHLHRDKRHPANRTPAAQPANPERGKVTSPRSAVPNSGVVYLTVAEVAKIMRVSKMTVYRLCHTGELENIKIGRSFRVREEAVKDYLGIEEGEPLIVSWS
jgi:excisionase family DNA binding protein